MKKNRGSQQTSHTEKAVCGELFISPLVLQESSFKKKVGHLCSIEIPRILALLLGIYSSHTLPAVIVQLWYLKNGSLLTPVLSHTESQFLPCLALVPSLGEDY